MTTALAAVVGLIAALVFNGVQLSNGNEQARQDHLTAQLQLLNSVGLDYAKARAAGTDSPDVRALLFSHGHISDSSIPPDKQRAMFEAIELESALAEQYAYMLNHNYVDLPGAVKPGPLVCTWRRVVAVQRKEYATYEYKGLGLPELRAFELSHPGHYLCPPPRRPS
jgi:hypothetical protein